MAADTELKELIKMHHASLSDKSLEEWVRDMLVDQLSDPLDNTFRVVKTDLNEMKFIIEFDIHIVPDDGYVGVEAY